MSRASTGRQQAILRTKLVRPPLPADVVRRKAALELMQGAAETPATLVCAPAGYGKSVLVSQWLEEREQGGVWLTLGESESKLQLFLTYLLAGIEDLFPATCDQTWSLLARPEPPSVEDFARAFANDLESFGPPAALILDDYHRIETTSEVHGFLSRLIEHPPRPLRLIILSRRDPPLPLLNLRASATLTELRMRDLCFSAEETEELLATSARSPVRPEAVAHLQQQTEGWAVGLRLVLSALRHVEDTDAFLRGLRGDLHQIQEYLLQEVLSELSPSLRRLVVLSSLFERFCAEVLDAVASSDDEEVAGNGSDSARLFEALRRGDLFAVRLDAEGSWYRYHHRFRDLVQAELARQLPEAEIARLHRRASAWFEGQGLIDEALTHALAAGEPELAADVVVRHYREDSDRDLWHEIGLRLDRLPPELEQQRLDLMIARLGVFQETGEMFAMMALAEKAQAAATDARDSEQRAELDLRLGMIDVFLHGDGESARRRLERARRHLPASSQLQANCEYYLASARAMLGEGDAAVAELAEQIRSLASSEVDLLSRLLASHATLSLLLGNLGASRRSASRLAAVARDFDRPQIVSWGHYLEATSRFHRHELEEAVPGFHYSGSRPNVLHRRVVLDALAGLVYCHQALGRDELADATLNLLEDLTRSSEPHHVDVVDSCRARLQLQRGDVRAAIVWARSFERDVHPGTIFSFLEVPALTQTRVWIATGDRGPLDRALVRLDELRALASRLHLNSQLIEIDALRATALARSDRKEEALDVAARLVEVAWPQRWIRPLAEAGATMVELIDGLRRNGRGESERAELDDLLTAVEDAGATASGKPPGEGDPVTAGAEAAETLLTNRELDVIELLSQRLQDKEIAAHLGISSHTVKAHLKALYGKLGVGGRRKAVSRALSLGILDLLRET